MARLTVSVPDVVAEAAKSIADNTGTSVSALAARGLRDQVAAAAAAAYQPWLDANPDIKAELEGWRETTDDTRWASLPPAA
jgi:hypothetical protein